MFHHWSYDDPLFHTRSDDDVSSSLGRESLEMMVLTEFQDLQDRLDLPRRLETDFFSILIFNFFSQTLFSRARFFFKT